MVFEFLAKHSLNPLVLIQALHKARLCVVVLCSPPFALRRIFAAIYCIEKLSRRVKTKYNILKSLLKIAAKKLKGKSVFTLRDKSQGDFPQGERMGEIVFKVKKNLFLKAREIHNRSECFCLTKTYRMIGFRRLNLEFFDWSLWLQILR